MSKIVILGTGAFASAMAQVLTDNNHKVLMYGIDRSEIDDINNNHQNQKYFQDLPLNKSIKATSDLATAISGATVIIFAVPSAALPQLCQNLNQLITKPCHFINIAKGFDPKTGDRLSIMIRKSLNSKIIANLSGLYGPSLASEIVLRTPTQVSAVSKDLKFAREIQKFFNNKNFSVVLSDDIISVECISALKNVIAIISGMLRGQNASDNTVASFITIGLNEAVKYSLANGGKIATFLSPAGIGDLILTSMSPKSRNYHFGYEIGKTNDPQKIIAASLKTVEGYGTCKLIIEQAVKQDIKLPLFLALYRILYHYDDPKLTMQEFFSNLEINNNYS